MSKVLVTGGEGQLAKCFMREVSPRLEVVLTSKSQLDIRNESDWAYWLSEVEPDILLHTAAYTDVAGAERHAQEAHELNVKAVRLAARVCKAHGVRFLLVSTDYVFDGELNRAYRPDDIPAPLSVYGRTKQAGESAAFEENPDTVIVRVSWLYSPFGKNFMLTMLRLFKERTEVSVVNDQVSSPTCGLTFAHYLEKFILKKPTGGIYHFSLAGEGSWFDLAEAICRETGSEVHVKPVTTEEFPSGVDRPAYSKLDATGFEQVVGERLPHWREALTYCIQTYLNEHSN